MSPSRLVPALVAAASLALLAGAVAFAVAGPGDDAPAGAAEPGIAPGGGSSGSIGAPGSVGAPDAAVGEARSLPVVTSDPPVPHGGDGSAPPRGITVTGTAIVEGTADESEWSFGVQAQADDARTALAEAAEAANRLVAALRREGVAERDMRTENVSVWPTHDERGGVSGYTASTSVRTLVRDLARAGRVVDAAVAAGANQVSGPSFSASARDALYRQALAAAVEQARVSARALAEAAGGEVGEVLALREAGSAPAPVAEAAMAADARADMPIQPGRQQIAASVTVTFALNG